MTLIVGLFASVVGGGCAIHYFDAETGTEHLWGIGHMKARITPVNEGLKAVVRGVEVFGLGIGRDDTNSYFTLGWHNNQRLEILDENTSVRLEWCGSDFANIRVGSEFPKSLEGAEPKRAHTSRSRETNE
jgi:hypothetical protein